MRSGRRPRPCPGEAPGTRSTNPGDGLSRRWPRVKRSDPHRWPGPHHRGARVGGRTRIQAKRHHAPPASSQDRLRRVATKRARRRDHEDAPRRRSSQRHRESDGRSHRVSPCARQLPAIFWRPSDQPDGPSAVAGLDSRDERRHRRRGLSSSVRRGSTRFPPCVRRWSVVLDRPRHYPGELKAAARANENKATRPVQGLTGQASSSGTTAVA